MFYACAATGSGVGPVIMGEGFDRLGSYQAVLVAFEVGLAIAAFLMSRLGPYRYAVDAGTTAPEGEALATEMG
jgi:cyanate permease